MFDDATLTRRAWVGIYVLITLAWVDLYLLALDHSLPPLLGSLDAAFHADLWRQLCVAQPSADTFWQVLWMWLLMSTAMMLPTALPFLGVYADLRSTANGGGTVSLGGAAVGYLTVWFTFALAAAALQVALAGQGQISHHGILLDARVSAGLLIAAGVYQFAPFKRELLRQCQRPMVYVFSHWRSGFSGAFRTGLAYGLRCVGCCWALMLLAFVAGTMNLAWMGVATVLMVAEKFELTGRFTAVATGIALLLVAGVGLGT